MNLNMFNSSPSHIHKKELDLITTIILIIKDTLKKNKGKNIIFKRREYNPEYDFKTCFFSAPIRALS